MTVNLVAYPKAATQDLTMYDQPMPVLYSNPIFNTIVMFMPGLTEVMPTPEEIAKAVWEYTGGRSLTA